MPGRTMKILDLLPKQKGSEICRSLAMFSVLPGYALR